jgi:hypothetical protein
LKARAAKALVFVTLLAALFTLASYTWATSKALADEVKPTFTAISFWGINESHALMAFPGGSLLPLTVVIYYLGPVNLYNVSVTFKPSYPLELVRGQPKPSAFSPLLQPGAALRLVSLYNVSSNATVGIYNETLDIKYYVQVPTPTGGTTLIEGSQEVQFQVAITGYSKIAIVGYSTYPNVIYAGDLAALLQAYLINEGNVVAPNVTVKVIPTWPLSLLYPNMSVIRLGYLPPGRVVNVTAPLSIANVSEIASYPFGYFRVPEPFNATVYLNVSYAGGSALIPITVYVRPSAHFAVINVYHGDLSVGSSNVYVTVELADVGLDNASYVTATLLPNPIFTPYVPSSENPLLAVDFMNESLGSLTSGSYANVTFVVSVSSGIKPGTYYLPLLLTWYQPPTMQVMHQVVLVPLSVGSGLQLKLPSGSSSNLALYVIAAVVVIILIVMAVVGARRR